MLVALVLGAVGSLHCVGMCGPLAMLIQGPVGRKMLVNRLLYNVGRTITYALAGLVTGLLGEVVQLSGYQSILSIVMGVVVILFLVFPVAAARLSPMINTFLNKIKMKLATLLKMPRYSSALGVGMLNGILPCGMVYMALALAVLQNTLLESVAFMALFGLATIPALLVTAYAGNVVKKYIPVSWKKVQTVFLILLAALMIGRGFMLEGGFDLHFMGAEITHCN